MNELYVNFVVLFTFTNDWIHQLITFGAFITLVKLGS